MSNKYLFKQIIRRQDGFLRGPFGGDLKKEIFVEKGSNTYKVYEQGVVLNSDKNIGRYYISESDYLKKLHKFSVQDKDFLVSCSGVNMGAIYQLKDPFEKGIINQALLRIRLNNELIDDNYFLYLFRELIGRKITTGSGDSTIPNFPGLDVIRNIEFELPSKDVQEKVGKLLFTLDAKIELNQRINAQLEAMAKTLYDYWFVQFDFPNAAGQPYKSSGGKMVWNEELKRKIPQGWEVCELRKYLTANRGVSYGGKDIIASDGLPMINLNSFNSNSTYKPEGIKSFSGQYAETKVLKPFDLVMCNTQQTALDPAKDIIGKSFLIPDIFESDIVSSHHVTTITVEKEILKYYLNSLFNSEYFHRYISGYATGTNILGLNFEGVLSYRTAIPYDDLLERYKAIVVNVEKQKSRIIKENQTLTELRDWLLPMLMNGQVTVA